MKLLKLVNKIEYGVEMIGAGEPLVLLHGFTGSGASWWNQVAAFSAAFTIVTVDLLGHGCTAAPADPQRYTMENAAADLVALVQQLGFERFHLLGYSMGGRLALYTAVHYPHHINRLILESASPGLEDPAARTARVQSDQALAARIETQGIEAFVEEWEQLPLFATQTSLAVEVQQRVRAGRLGNNATGLANSLRGMGTGVQPSLWSSLATVTAPTLLITGALDAKFVAIAAQMARLLPESQHEVIADAGHTVHLEQPGAYNDQVLQFLRGAATPR